MADVADIERVASVGDYTLVVPAGVPSPLRWIAGRSHSIAGRSHSGLHGLRELLGDVSLKDIKTQDLLAKVREVIPAVAKDSSNINIELLGRLLFLDIPRHAEDLRASQAGPADEHDATTLLLGIIHFGEIALAQLQRDVDEKQRRQQQAGAPPPPRVEVPPPLSHAEEASGSGGGPPPPAVERELREAQPEQEPADPVDACVCHLAEGMSDEDAEAKYGKYILQVR